MRTHRPAPAAPRRDDAEDDRAKVPGIPLLRRSALGAATAAATEDDGAAVDVTMEAAPPPLADETDDDRAKVPGIPLLRRSALGAAATAMAEDGGGGAADLAAAAGPLAGDANPAKLHRAKAAWLPA